MELVRLFTTFEIGIIVGVLIMCLFQINKTDHND